MRSTAGPGGAALGIRGGWQRTVGTGLAGKRRGIAGPGRIGRQVAECGRAFGMRVTRLARQALSPAHR
jgi:phosphoglycerate dehydrogenase-like enzyme